jgi:bifunctional N-acetylglucosamine-1-phosphate-uridyltransferase/glucosamine-1-phosphate-acetyltransferase GlmU-like protein
MAGYIGSRAVTSVSNTDSITVTGDVTFDGVLTNDDSIDADVVILSGRNAAVIGPVTINADVTVTGTLTIL